MKNKLTINELAPYLPYGLKMMCYPNEPEHSRLGELVAIDSDKLYNEDWYISAKCIINEDSLRGNYGVDEFKPILRPLSDLTQLELRQIIDHLFRDSKCFRPQMESVKHDKGFISFYDYDTMRTYVAVKPSGKDNLPVLNMSNTWQDYSIFFKLHVDMMGLIDKGLAINANTLTNKK